MKPILLTVLLAMTANAEAANILYCMNSDLRLLVYSASNDTGYEYLIESERVTTAQGQIIRNDDPSRREIFHNTKYRIYKMDSGSFVLMDNQPFGMTLARFETNECTYAP